MKNFKKLVAMFALVVMVGLSSTLLFACGGDTTKDRLSIYQEFNTEYYVGDTLDVSRGILKYIDGENKVHFVPLEQEMIDAGTFSTNLPGTWNMVITYENETLVVSYTVKAYDIKDGVYYKVDASESTGQGAYNYTYYIFNLEENTLTEIYSNGSPFEAVDGGMHFDIERTETEQHFIEYTAVLKGAPMSATAKITDIGKNSFKFQTVQPFSSAAITCYEYVA